MHPPRTEPHAARRSHVSARAAGTPCAALAAAAALAALVAACAPASAADEQGEERPIFLPPLLESRRLESGAWRTSFALIYHRTRLRDGRTHSWHLGPYFEGEGYRVLFPVLYDIGEGADRRRGLLPFFLRGPGYAVMPPLLSWRTSRPDGSSSSWITPLYHHTRAPSGEIRSWHLATYARGPGYSVLFPLFYSAGDAGRRHRGIVPIWFEGPGYRTAPLALSSWRRRSDGSTRSWITPLYHHTREADGSIRDFHLATYVQGPGYKVLFPLGYATEFHRGVVPLVFAGMEYAIVPPLASARVENSDGSRSTWVTPLFHVTRGATGVRDWHALTYFHGAAYRVLFPLAYAAGGALEHRGVVPAWFRGPTYTLVPPLLSARARAADGLRSVWITPLYHRTTDASGAAIDFHALNYFAGPRYRVLFPFAYAAGPPGDRHRGILPPLFFQGPGYAVSPPLMSGRWRGRDGSTSSWITPLFHVTRDAGGVLRSMHALTYLQGPEYKILFPFAYSVGRAGSKHRAAVPLYFGGPGYGLAPLALSGWWRSRGGTDWTWITPLFHRAVNADGSLRHMHAFTFFQAPRYQILFPFYYSLGAPGERHRGVIPFAFWGPGYCAVPLALPFYCPTRRGALFPVALSGRWEGASGAKTLMITPLFHRTVNADGSLRHMHALNYFRGETYSLFLPFGYSYGPAGDRRSGFVPLYFQGPTYKAAPLIMSGSWQSRDGSRSTWVTPLFHRTVDADGKLRHAHLATYLHGPGYRVLFPIAYSVGASGAKHRGLLPFCLTGRQYCIAPAGASAWTKKNTGEESLWVTPLFHLGRDSAGAVRDYHALTWFRGPSYKVLFPFGYSVGSGAKHRGVLPLWFAGPRYTILPPALAARSRHADDSRSTWVTPLFHATRGADGKLRDWHALTVFRGERYRAVFPVFYRAVREAGAHTGIVPFAFTGPRYVVIPPLVAARVGRADGSRSTWVTPLFHVTRGATGVRDWHALIAFHGSRYNVVFPFYYDVGKPDRRHRGVVPFWFQGPGYAFGLPLICSRTAPDGSRTEWVTPFYHRSRDPSGAIRHMHAFLYFQNRSNKILFPVYWQRTNALKETFRFVPLLWWSRHAPNGDRQISVVPPLSMYRRGRRLDLSPARLAWPFYHQRAGADFEFRFLWGAFSRARTGTRTDTYVFPFWRSSRPAGGVPAQCQFLGGLVARDCNYRRGTYRYRILWVWPIGPRRQFTPPQ